MELKFALLAAVVCVSILHANSEILRKRRVKIHVPLEVKHHKHTHTIIKNIYHNGNKGAASNHKKAIKVHKPKEQLHHEHVHHHYKLEDELNLNANDHLFAPSDKKEKAVFKDNLVNIDNDAVESLDSLQSQKVETVQPVENEPEKVEAKTVSEDTSAESSKTRRRHSFDYEDYDTDE